jgi:hypothetical protein
MGSEIPICELVNDIVATPAPLKMLDGKLPVGVFMPIMSGKGPAPLGVVMVELSVIELPPCVTTTFSLPPEKVALTSLGGAPFGPDTQCCIWALISARRQRHSLRLAMRMPLAIKNGSGRLAIAGRALNGGGAGGGLQSAPVFSTLETGGNSPPAPAVGLVVPPVPAPPLVLPPPPTAPSPLSVPEELGLPAAAGTPPLLVPAAETDPL